MSKVIAITGGIGSGKSYISNILLKMGYPVYDCDSRAKEIMNTSVLIKSELKEEFGEDILIKDEINKPLLAKIVFNDRSKLRKLNRIVHPKVTEDIMNWIKTNEKYEYIFIETAILKESGLEKVTDKIWIVDAPVDVRIQRVSNRDKMDIKDIKSRIDSQNNNLVFDRSSVINNSSDVPLLPQIWSLFKG